jgi:hypothetical protein
MRQQITAISSKLDKLVTSYTTLQNWMVNKLDGLDMDIVRLTKRLDAHLETPQEQTGGFTEQLANQQKSLEMLTSLIQNMCVPPSNQAAVGEDVGMASSPRDASVPVATGPEQVPALTPSEQTEPFGLGLGLALGAATPNIIISNNGECGRTEDLERGDGDVERQGNVSPLADKQTEKSVAEAE